MHRCVHVPRGAGLAHGACTWSRRLRERPLRLHLHRAPRRRCRTCVTRAASCCVPRSPHAMRPFPGLPARAPVTAGHPAGACVARVLYDVDHAARLVNAGDNGSLANRRDTVSKTLVFEGFGPRQQRCLTLCEAADATNNLLSDINHFGPHSPHVTRGPCNRWRGLRST